MSVGPEEERARPGAVTDAVTFSFADPAAELYGLARLGLSGAGDARRGSALAVLFAGRAPVAAIAEGDVAVAPEADWAALSLPGLAASVEAPLERWSVRMAGERHGFALTFEAVSPPAELGADDPAARAGGMAGYEQLCRVRGEVALDGELRAIEATGQRGHAWGAPDWRRLASAHTLSVWLEGERGVALTALHGAGDKGHGEGEHWASLLDPDGVTPVADPRLSTTYDGDGRQRRAGLELWVGEDEDEYPRRAAGTVLCGSTLELGQLRLDCAFMRWTMEGRTGVGRYDVLRRA
ncbi:MAG: hypothetical protein M3P50_10040 [Actinomycetota bacterium]|nr:hypothetical protein [Actinomycetota bacterium]